MVARWNRFTEVVSGCSSHSTPTTRARRPNAQIICESDQSLSIDSLHFSSAGGLSSPARASLRMLSSRRYFPPHRPCRPILKGAEDTCTDRTWWRTKAARALMRKAPETKTNTRLCAAPSTCPGRAAAPLMSCQRRLVVAQSSQSAGLSIFFILVLGLYLVEEGFGTSVG